MSYSASVKELLAALEEAKKRAPPTVDIESLTEEEFEQCMWEMEEGDGLPMGHKLGVSKRLFIPEPELDDEEVEALVAKILEVWDHFHYCAEFPEGLTRRQAYRRLLSVWDEPVEDVPYGQLHFLLFDEGEEEW